MIVVCSTYIVRKEKRNEEKEIEGKKRKRKG